MKVGPILYNKGINSFTNTILENNFRESEKKHFNELVLFKDSSEVCRIKNVDELMMNDIEYQQNDNKIEFF